MGGESDDCAMYVGMFCVVIHCGVEGCTMCVYCTMCFFYDMYYMSEFYVA